MGQSHSFYTSLHSYYFPSFLRRFFSAAKSLGATPPTEDLAGELQSRTQAVRIRSSHHAPRSYVPSFLRRLFGAAKSLGATPPPPTKDSAEVSKPRTPTTIHSIPNELLLHIFSFLELRPYIFAHGVCADWKQLLPLADMHPTRRRLLDLYNRILHTPDFEKSLDWSLKYLQPFDRQNYIDTLLAQYPVIPGEFRMWILEWPEKLVIGCLWPALPFVFYVGPKIPGRWYGVNWLSYRPSSPALVAPFYTPKLSSKTARVPCLLFWRYDSRAYYLVFDSEHPSIFGRVYVTGWEEDEGPDVIPNGLPRYPDSDSDEESENGDANDNAEREYYVVEPFADWISFLVYRWEGACQKLTQSTSTHSLAVTNEIMKEPVRYDDMGMLSMTFCPTPLWDATRY